MTRTDLDAQIIREALARARTQAAPGSRHLWAIEDAESALIRLAAKASRADTGPQVD